MGGKIDVWEIGGSTWSDQSDRCEMHMFYKDFR